VAGVWPPAFSIYLIYSGFWHTLLSLLSHACNTSYLLPGAGVHRAALLAKHYDLDQIPAHIYLYHQAPPASSSSILEILGGLDLWSIEREVPPTECLPYNTADYRFYACT